MGIFGFFIGVAPSSNNFVISILEKKNCNSDNSYTQEKIIGSQIFNLLHRSKLEPKGEANCPFRGGWHLYLWPLFQGIDYYLQLLHRSDFELS